MNDEILIELGIASEETKGCKPALIENFVDPTHRDGPPGCPTE